MRVDLECGKYTYIFEDGRARLLRYDKPTCRDVVGDKLIYCMAVEIDELRQQIATKDTENAELRQQVPLLREFVKLLRDYIPAAAVGNTTVQEALAATEPKP